METLRIHLFGGLDLFRGSRALPAFATQRAKGLFAFLAFHHGRPYAREVLMGRFWGDRPQSTARKCLRTDIWRVRQVVEEGGCDACLRVKNDEVGFDADSDHWLDVREFERRLAQVPEGDEHPLTPCTAALLAEAVELYRGDLLEGIYDDWCLFERERLRLRFLDALERLMAWHARHGAWLQASLHAQRLLSHDPLREHVHRDLMRFLAYAGDRPGALRQFATCERLLLRELELEPMEETAALAEEIRAGTLRAPLRELAAAPRPHLSWPSPDSGRAAGPVALAAPLLVGQDAEPRVDAVLDRLREASAWLEVTNAQLQTIIHDVEQVRQAAGGVPGPVPN
jgi:DNA-binding SARP family transcriptional activator